MRLPGGLIGILAILPLSVWAGERQPMRPVAAGSQKEFGNQKRGPEYTEFSRLVHKLVVKQLPKQFEDASGWGQMIEVPGNLRLMALRKIVKVGDHLEAPHGAWRRFNGKIEDPDKNLKIAVKDFKKLDDKKYRIKVDVDATILCQGEWQQWRKGLLLVGADATADANITAAIVCDVGVSLNLKKFPPELNIEPTVSELGLELVDFKLRGDPIIKGEKGDALRNNLKEVLRAVVKTSESFVKDQANLAIAQGLREGKGTISAGAIMKALPK